MPQVGRQITQEAPQAPLTPHWQTADGETARLYLGSVFDVLPRLEPQSVHCVVTSPPYWGQRDYRVVGQLGSEPSPDCGTQGKAQCGSCFVCNMVRVFRMVRRVLRDDGTLWLNLGDKYVSGRNEGTSTVTEGDPSAPEGSPARYALRVITVSAACDFNRMHHSRLPRIEEFNARKGAHAVCYGAYDGPVMVGCAIWSSPVARRFEHKGVMELRRMALSPGRADNTATWMLGKMAKDITKRFPDLKRLISYQDTDVHSGTIYRAANWKPRHVTKGGGEWNNDARSATYDNQTMGDKVRWELDLAPFKKRPAPREVPPGNLIGLPWRVAFALQADGWVLRQDIIWHKPDPMPAPMKDRCVTAHEYLFLFVKKQRYFFDHVAIRERARTDPHPRGGNYRDGQSDGPMDRNGHSQFDPGEQDRVYGADGFANKRSVWTVTKARSEGNHYAVFPPELVRPMILAGTSEKGCCFVCGRPWKRVTKETTIKRDRPNTHVKRTGEVGTGNTIDQTNLGSHVVTTGWVPQCDCDCGEDDITPCVVMDPFGGTMTTGAVCIQEGRHFVGIELNPETMADDSVTRIKGELLERPAMAWLTGDAAKAVDLG